MVQEERVTRKIARMGKMISPYGEHTVRVSLVALIVLVALLEFDQIWDGTVYAVWQWIWITLLGYKTVTFALGMLTCYLLMRHRKGKQETGIRDRMFKTAPIRLDMEALEEHAKKMGIELDLKSDPRISRINDLKTPVPGEKK